MATAQASTVAERNHASTVTYEQARRLANRIKADWHAGESADAQVCIQTNPQLRLHRSLVLDLAYEEFCLRLEAGESVKVDEFCKRFPSVTRSLLRRVEVHEYLLKDSQYLGSLIDIEWPKLGDRILRFWLHEELGRGTFARVYLATQAGLGNRQVVLKVANCGSQEAELLGKLKHPNIVPIHSVEFDDSRNLTCLCMPFLGRSTLCDVLDRAFENGHSPASADVILDAARQHGTNTDEYDGGPAKNSTLSRESYEDGVLSLMEQMANGLCHAHDQKILHADLKPVERARHEFRRRQTVGFQFVARPNCLARRVGRNVTIHVAGADFGDCAGRQANQDRRAFRYLLVRSDCIRAAEWTNSLCRRQSSSFRAGDSRRRSRSATRGCVMATVIARQRELQGAHRSMFGG